MSEVTRGERPRWGKVHLHVVSELAPDWKAIGVYVALCAYADPGGRAWPKQETLAGELHVGVSTVRRALRSLEDAEVIRTTSEANGAGTRNVYTVAALA